MTARKILLLDLVEDRRYRFARILKDIPATILDSRASIDQGTYESSDYSVAVVHFSNDEGPYIESVWKSPNTRILLFSGSFRPPLSEEHGIYYARAGFLEQSGELARVIQKEILR